MDISRFNFELPAELIAQYPTARRTSSRLLVPGHEAGQQRELLFSDVATLLSPGDLVIVNNTRVLPARMAALRPTGGRVEIMLERITSDNQALVLLGANKPVKPGQALIVGDHTIGVTGRSGAFFELTFPASAITVFEQYGKIPLPPYIDRPAGDDDLERYQTVFSQIPGAVAAPTAGLHFDDELIETIQDNGVDWGEITLHVGAGTFQPVRESKIENHQMHSERIEVNESVCEQVAQTRSRGGRVVAVGTTVVRALETAAASGNLLPSDIDTSLFITPGYQFRVVDALITNFHLPKSTLLMMVSAFTGYERLMATYRYAIANQYRFFSYGDAMFLEKQQ